MPVPFQIELSGLDQLLMLAIFNILFHVSGTSESFHPVRTLDGFSTCAVDRPAYSVSVDDIVGIPFGVPNEVLCAYQCSVKNPVVSCMAFNVNDTHCQFYNSTTNHCFAASTTCVYVQVIPTFKLFVQDVCVLYACSHTSSASVWRLFTALRQVSYNAEKDC